MADPANGRFWNDEPTNEENLRLIEEMRKMEEAKAKQEEKRTEREKVKRGLGNDAATGPRQLVARSLAGVAMHAIEWLWTGWIPKGYLTLVAGESCAGKSAIWADIAGRVTTGRPWPGEFDCPNAWRKPERVLWLGSEDSIEEITIPRLVACGANLDNVFEIQCAVQDGKRSTFSMQDDLEEVAKGLAYARDVQQRDAAQKLAHEQQCQVKVLPMAGEELMGFLNIQPSAPQPLEAMDPAFREQAITNCMDVLRECGKQEDREQALSLLGHLGVLQ